MGLTPMPDHDDAPLPTNIADDETAIASALTSPPASPTAIGGARGRIVAAAAIIMVGQLLSSVLGLVRIETLNVLFIWRGQWRIHHRAPAHPAGERSRRSWLGQWRADPHLCGLRR